MRMTSKTKMNSKIKRTSNLKNEDELKNYDNLKYNTIITTFFVNIVDMHIREFIPML